MNKAVINSNLFAIAHFSRMDSTSNVKTLQDLVLEMIAFGNVWAQSSLSSGTDLCKLCISKKTLYSISEPSLIHIRIPAS